MTKMKPNEKEKTSVWKRPIQAKYLFATLGAAGLLLAIIVVPAIFATPTEKYSSLYFQKIEPMLLENYNTGHNLTKATVTVDVYITNLGNKDSGPVVVEGYAKDTYSGMSYARATWAESGVPAKGTVKATLSFSLPIGYVYNIILYGCEDSLLILEGRGAITLKSSGSISVNPFETNRQNNNGWNPYDSERRDPKAYRNLGEASDSTALGGVCLILVLLVVVGAVMYALSRSGKKKQTQNLNPWQQTDYPAHGSPVPHGPPGAPPQVVIQATGGIIPEPTAESEDDKKDEDIPVYGS